MDEIENLVTEVLERGHVMSLATIDDGGLWVSDVIYIFDENQTIYWMSKPDTRHSKALLENPRVAGSITISNKSKEPNLGIQFSGIAGKIDGPRHDLAKKHFAKRNHPEPTIDEDVLKGSSWYQLKPEVIELIHEELFGRVKKRYNK